MRRSIILHVFRTQGDQDAFNNGQRQVPSVTSKTIFSCKKLAYLCVQYALSDHFLGYEFKDGKRLKDVKEALIYLKAFEYNGLFYTYGHNRRMYLLGKF